MSRTFTKATSAARAKAQPKVEDARAARLIEAVRAERARRRIARGLPLRQTMRFLICADAQAEIVAAQRRVAEQIERMHFAMERMAVPAQASYQEEREPMTDRLVYRPVVHKDVPWNGRLVRVAVAKLPPCRIPNAAITAAAQAIEDRFFENRSAGLVEVRG